MSSRISIYVTTLSGKQISTYITLEEEYGSDFLFASNDNSDDQINQMITSITTSKQLLPVFEKAISPDLRSWIEDDNPSFYSDVENIGDISELKEIIISEERHDIEDPWERCFVYSFIDSPSDKQADEAPIIDGFVLKIPANVKEINMGCLTEYGFSEIIVDPNNNFFAIDKDGSLCSKDGKTLYIFQGGLEGEDFDEINIPEGYEVVAEFAFYCQDMIYKVSLPKTIKKIEQYAFAECSMHTIYIPISLTEIDETAFQGCDELEIIRY